MDGLAIVQVSGLVVALMYLLRWEGVSRRWATFVVPLLSAVGVGVWAYAHGSIDRAAAFGYLAGWVAVTTSAATVWGFSWAAATRLGTGRRRRKPVAGSASRAHP